MHDLSNIVNSANYCYRGKKLKPITATLIEATHRVGMDEITAANAAEFYARLGLVGCIEDSALYLITPEDVVNHIGLRTDAGTCTRHELVTRLTDMRAGACKAMFNNWVKWNNSEDRSV
jgi:hypothetical protein